MKIKAGLPSALFGILILEALLFSWTFDCFFNGDSLFYLSNRITSLDEGVRKFTGPDHLWQYRPLTYVIFSWFLYPLFGTKPVSYHGIPLLAHMANTVLVYFLLRRLLRERGAAGLGTFFFGIHSTAFYITYGIAFLPDFSFSFFYLLSILCFLKHFDSGSRRLFVVSLILYGLSLLCKEAAVSLPFILLLILLLEADRSQFKLGALGKELCNAFRKSYPFFMLLFLYLGMQWWFKSSHLYPTEATHPHYFNFSLESLRLKYKYLKWAFNLPNGLIFEFQGISNYVLALGLALFIIPFLVHALRGLSSGDRYPWTGFLWFAMGLVPVLFLPHLTMHHYLYISLVGLAIPMAKFMSSQYAQVKRRSPGWARAGLLGFLLVTILSVGFHNQQALETSWIAEASQVAEQSLKDLKAQRPDLPKGAILYIFNQTTKDLAWFYDYGSLFRIFYDDPSIQTLFAERGARPPQNYEADARVIFLLFDGRKLEEISNYDAQQISWARDR